VTLSHSGCVMRGPDGQVVGEVRWNANDLERIDHEPKADAKADVQSYLDWTDSQSQTRHHEPQVVTEVEKGSSIRDGRTRLIVFSAV